MATSFDTLANFVNQEADYNFASGLELVKKQGGLQVPIPAALNQMWQNVREPVMGAVQGVDKVMEWPFGSVAGPGVAETATKMVFPETAKEALVGGIANLTPGMIASNFRTPEQIQALRKVIAEEMRSRGPVGSSTKDIIENAPATKVYPPIGGTGMEFYDTVYAGFSPQKMAEERQLWSHRDSIPYKVGEKEIPDPFDLILRGTPYHGMTEKARPGILGKAGPNFDFRDIDTWPEEMLRGMKTIDVPGGEVPLATANFTGFNQSLHNSQSMSNKWGEPAGVSTSFLPTKSGTMFSPDEYIHRLLPLYGGPPTERVVNLMQQGGRETLRDAYTRAFGKLLTESDPAALNRLARYSRESIESPLNLNPLERSIRDFQQSSDLTGKFNLGLSNELQSMGKRGILYNPQRYDEYEMLMLDPKYALPLDYRMFQEYAHPAKRAWEKSPKAVPGDAESATPGVQRGLEQIQDIMSQNHSRLGDIYSERPWQGYLTPEVKENLLQRVGPDYREQVGNMLNDIRQRNLDIPF